jgi:hypothetical protein
MAAVTVSDIRREIWRAAGAPSSDGAGAEAGRLFHLVAAEMLGGESGAAWSEWFEEEGLESEDAAKTYAAAVYESVLGPALAESASAFAENPQALLRLWNGVQGFSGWLVGVLRECRKRGLIQWQGRRGWQGSEALARTELPLIWRVSQPGWTAPVEVRGTLDALFRDPSSGRWMVVEWKLASVSPEADVAQLCLYHRMLEANGEGGAAALVSFDPEVRQTLLSAARIEEVQQRLVDLIGRMAGVAAPAVRKAVAPLLDDEPVAQPRPASASHLELAAKAVEVLRARGHDVSLGQPVHAGPTFLQIPLRLAPRTKVRRVMSEAHDLQVQLGLKSAPILRRGEGCVLLEIPRPDRETVHFKSLNLRGAAGFLAPLLIGVDLTGRVHFTDLADSRTPHLLVVGSTGSGKSEWMRAAIAGLMATHTPADLRLVLIDPKRTAFAGLRRTPYLWDRLAVLMPPDDDMIEAFDVLIEEMESRYRGMERLGAADLSEWKSRDKSAPPRIVVLCDEYADLVQSAGRKEIEARIARLGAKARAAGIHLVLATQRASRDVVTGVIKANLTGRVCLRVAEPIESRLVLNVAGAENLTGHGDLLWSAGGEPLRLQAPLLDEESRVRYFGPAERQAGGSGT